MDTPRIVWADMRQFSGPEHFPTVDRTFQLERIRWPDPLDPSAGQPPIAACFEFDYPDIPRLGALQAFKESYPGIPVVMLTEEHSEALAVWALRVRVWDYFVIPVDAEALSRTLNALYRASLMTRDSGPRVPIRPVQCLPPEARFREEAAPPRDRLIYRVVAALPDRLDQRLSASELARECGLSLSHFSRRFRELYEVTFQEYLLAVRMEQAARLLGNRNAAIADVAWAVGYRDISYFTRMFRRYWQSTPSQFRRVALERRIHGDGRRPRLSALPTAH